MEPGVGLSASYGSLPTQNIPRLDDVMIQGDLRKLPTPWRYTKDSGKGQDPRGHAEDGIFRSFSSQGRALRRVLHPLQWGTAQSLSWRAAQGQSFSFFFSIGHHGISELHLSNTVVFGEECKRKKGQLWVFKEQVFQ